MSSATHTSTTSAGGVSIPSDLRNRVVSAIKSSTSEIKGNGRSNSVDSQFRFKREKSFDFRLAESKRIREKYPDRIPIIIERSASSPSVPDIDKKKFLVPYDLTLGQFVYVIRKRIRLSPTEAIFIFIRNVLPTTSATVSEIYAEHHDEDGFLYATYSGENTFGF